MNNALFGTRNQLANVTNHWQGSTKKILFVCSAGLLRSPTAAHVFSSPPYSYNTRAAGSNSEYALIPVTHALLEWADHVIIMQDRNLNDIEYELGTELFQLYFDKMRVLNIPDNFKYRNEELIEMLEKKVVHVLNNWEKENDS